MLAIIPARGGSKGLPGKNVKSLNGLPLIAYTINAAKNSNFITEVVVSTDDPTIYQMSLDYGANPSFLRPSWLATDDAKAIDAYLYTVDKLNETRKKKN